MSTFGDPNTVGRNLSPPGINPQVAAQAAQIAPPEKPISTGRTVAGAALATGGAAATYRAIRPNVEGQRRRASERISSIDSKIANEGRYKKPNKALIGNLQRQRTRAVDAQRRINTNTATRYTPKLRLARGAVGAAGLTAGLATLKPLLAKKPKDGGSSGTLR